MITKWLGSAVVLFAIAGGASAQTSGGFGSFTPQQLNMTPVNLGAAGPSGTINAVGGSPFSLSGIFRQLFTPSPQRIMGSSAFPAPTYISPLQPLPPIMSTVQRGSQP